MIEQEPFCGVRTHFYYNTSSYDMFRDRRVVEEEIKLSYGWSKFRGTNLAGGQKPTVTKTPQTIFMTQKEPVGCIFC